jgi:hypothetical protein
MRLIARWGVAVMVSAVGFALAWWVCGKLIGLYEGVSLGGRRCGAGGAAGGRRVVGTSRRRQWGSRWQRRAADAEGAGGPGCLHGWA